MDWQCSKSGASVASILHLSRRTILPQMQAYKPSHGCSHVNHLSSPFYTFSSEGNPTLSASSSMNVHLSWCTIIPRHYHKTTTIVFLWTAVSSKGPLLHHSTWLCFWRWSGVIRRSTVLANPRSRNFPTGRRTLEKTIWLSLGDWIETFSGNFIFRRWRLLSSLLLRLPFLYSRLDLYP